MTLKKLLHYKNEHILDRYRKDFSNNKLSAEQALVELMKYFWLVEKHEQEKNKKSAKQAIDFDIPMYYEMQEIDDMWHTFLLFTRDYASFCQRYFGHFIHHCPNVDEKPRDTKEFQEEFERFASYVYDNFGEDTLRVWFAELFNDER